MKKNFILILFFLSPLYLLSWGPKGHKIVADIARTNLNSGIEKIVQKYLEDVSFEDASIWMDEIKSDSNFDYMKPWHYVNIEKNKEYHDVPDGDIVNELKRVIDELKNYQKMADKTVNLDLKILFHLCGDICQPLHTGYGRDQGGNFVKLIYNDEKTNLHHIWDSKIIESENITTGSCLQFAGQFSKEQLNSIQKIDVLNWMNDSRSLLQSVYNFNGFKISKNYINNNKIVIEKQLLKGGLRLAAVLNDIFKSN